MHALRACEAIGGAWSAVAGEWIKPFIRSIGGSSSILLSDINLGQQTCGARLAAINADGLAAIFCMQNQHAWRLRNEGEAGHLIDRAVRSAIRSKEAYDKARERLITMYKLTIPALTKIVKSLVELQSQIAYTSKSNHDQDGCSTPLNPSPHNVLTHTILDCMIAVYISSFQDRLARARTWRDDLRNIEGGDDEAACEVYEVLMSIEANIAEHSMYSNARTQEQWAAKKQSFVAGRDDHM
jgi:hypothetical protein